MKRVKYVIFIILLTIGFLFNGELYMLYMDNFQDSYYRCSFAFNIVEKDVADEKIVEDFLVTGEKHNVEFFFLQSEIESAYEKKD